MVTGIRHRNGPNGHAFFATILDTEVEIPESLYEELEEIFEQDEMSIRTRGSTTVDKKKYECGGYFSVG